MSRTRSPRELDASEYLLLMQLERQRHLLRQQLQRQLRRQAMLQFDRSNQWVTTPHYTVGNEPFLETLADGTVRLRGFDEKINDDLKCPICQVELKHKDQRTTRAPSKANDEKKIVILACNHYLHKSCFELCIENEALCPLCSAEMTRYADNIKSATQFAIKDVPVI